MNPLLLSFLKKLFLFSLVLGVLGYTIVHFLPDSYVTPALPFLFVFFIAITIVVHHILLKVSLKKARNFINYFMLLTFGKLMFFLTIILIYAFVYRSDALPFIISFFILYVFYTTFEVVLSLSHSKKARSQE